MPAVFGATAIMAAPAGERSSKQSIIPELYPRDLAPEIGSGQLTIKSYTHEKSADCDRSTNTGA